MLTARLLRKREFRDQFALVFLLSFFLSISLCALFFFSITCMFVCVCVSVSGRKRVKHSLFELFDDALVQTIAEVLGTVLARLQHDRVFVVGQLALGLGVAALFKE